MIMKVLVLCLVLSSLLTEAVLHPSQEVQNPTEDVIVKVGLRVVVVEYEKERDGGNTKILISPEQTQVSDKPPEVDAESYISAAKEKLSTAAEETEEMVKEASKVSISPEETQVPQKPPEFDDKSYISTAKEKLSTAAVATEEAAEEAKEKVKEVASSILSGLHPSAPPPDGRRSPRELVCDALGQCKHKIARALGKAKEKVAEKASEVEEQAKETVGEALRKVKERVSQKTEEISGKAREAKEIAAKTFYQA
ncbi:hypothetical protein U1Q18_036932 [Sarracenia purpurea var. burkii]